MNRILLSALTASLLAAASFAQQTAAQSACKAYFRLEPLDARVVNLLSTPLLPSARIIATSNGGEFQPNDSVPGLGRKPL